MTTTEPPLSTFFATLHECDDKQSLTHGIHPYPAKFIPHIPRELLREYAIEGLSVLDPMCGSGTTLVEATALGHPAIGVDLNPIAVGAARAKTTTESPSTRSELVETAACLRDGAIHPEQTCAKVEVPDFRNREKWFDDQVVKELVYALGLTTDVGRPAATVVRACVSAVVVGVSRQESETRWCAKPNDLPAGTTLVRIANLIDRASAAMEAYSALTPASSVVVRADARRIPVASSSVGTVVTSPPYANSHDYYLYNKLRMFILGFDVKPVQAGEIGSRNRHSDMKEPIDTYLTSMSDCLKEWKRVLVPGGHCAVVVADAVIRGAFYDMAEELRRVAQAADLELVDDYRFNHRQFNTTFQRGFGTNHEKQTHVLVFTA